MNVHQALVLTEQHAMTTLVAIYVAVQQDSQDTTVTDVCFV